VKQGPADPGQACKELRDILNLCVKCGRCRAVCPVFQAVGEEPAAARGKLALLEACLNRGGKLTGKRLQDVISLCLLCGRCTANCPNGAGAREAVELARSILAQQGELALPKRFLSRLSSMERSSRDPWVRTATLLQRLLMRELPQDSGLVLRFGGSGLGDLWAPRLRPPFFLERCREVVGKGKERVALFVGCAIHYLAPEIGEATLGILGGMGLEVIIPEGQGCCGLMAWGMGDVHGAALMARKVVEQFGQEDLEAILVPCASCAFHLSKGIPSLLREDPMGPRATLMAGKVRELSLFLAERHVSSSLGEEQDRPTGARLAYHDPCHLAVGMGIRSQPRELLARLAGWNYVEMPGAEECCGMGGSFRIFHPRVAARISGRKLRAIQEAQVQVVATTCMGCWMSLQEMLHRAGTRVTVRHVAELLWEELGETDGFQPRA